MSLVFSPLTGAVWEHTTEFVSYCEIGGKVFAANANGLFLLDSGDTDDGAQINAQVKFGNLPLAETNSRVSAAYVSASADGDLEISLSADEGEPVVYSVAPDMEDQLHRYRVLTARGMVGKYWQLSINNSAGSDFRLDSVELDVVPSSRRLR